MIVTVTTGKETAEIRRPYKVKINRRTKASSGFFVRSVISDGQQSGTDNGQSYGMPVREEYVRETDGGRSIVYEMSTSKYRFTVFIWNVYE